MSGNIPGTNTYMVPTVRTKFKMNDFNDVDEIGDGSEAIVYKGFSGTFGNVAIKLMNKLKEVDIVGTKEVNLIVKHSGHPNIVNFYGLVVSDYASSTCRGYVMEFMPMGCLDKGKTGKLSRSNKLGLKYSTRRDEQSLLDVPSFTVIHDSSIYYGKQQIFSWMQQISLGLGHLHREGIIHRDIKPRNLLLGPTIDILKISDFGTARLITSATANALTTCVGTYAYMAPEVLEYNIQNYSSTADIYSLAITLWEISRRKAPYSHLGGINFQILGLIVQGQRPELCGNPVSAQFDALVQRGWSVEPSARPLVGDFLEFAKTNGEVSSPSESEKVCPRNNNLTNRHTRASDRAQTQTKFGKLATGPLAAPSSPVTPPPTPVGSTPITPQSPGLPVLRAPKDCDYNWTFNVPREIAGLVIGTKGLNIKKYASDYNVAVRVDNSKDSPKQSTITINGPEASFKNVHTVCMQVWKSVASTRECLKRQFNQQQSLVLDGHRFNEFQQLLFMEDYNVDLLSPQLGSCWELRSFSQAELDTATTLLMNFNPFRQAEPIRSLARATSTLSLQSNQSNQHPASRKTSFETRGAAQQITPPRFPVQAQQAPQPAQRAGNIMPKKYTQKKGKKSGFYNPRTFETPQRIFVATEYSLGNCLKKTTNILLLGESGMGKSTFLNAFANYLEFGANFKKAEQGLRVCIRADYTISDQPITLLPTDGPDDYNERCGTGVSKTQEARCYTFLHNSGTEPKEIRVIDTPGLLDTEGVEKDQINIARILKCAKQFPEIHAILFLLKPDENRLTPSLRFVLTELLKRLHKEAAKNILFCFTRSDRNNPSCSTVPTLRGYFKNINNRHGVNIEMKNDSTVFHVDNFGFLYLGARKFHNFVGRGTERPQAGKQWKMSAETIESLLRTIAKLPPYPIQKTLEIQDTTNWLQAFSFQMAELSKQVISNQEKLSDKKKEIQRLLRENRSLEGHLTHKQTQVVMVPLDAHRVCCYSDKCSIVYNGNSRLPNICENRCNCYDGKYKKSEHLLKCKIFNELAGTCTMCGCPYSTHQRLKYKLESSTKQVIKEDGSSTTNTKPTDEQRATKACRKLGAEIGRSEKTLELLRKNLATFAAFVQQNSLLAVDDCFDMHLKLMLQADVSNTKLGEFRERYNREKALSGRGQTPVTIEEVREKMDELANDNVIGKEVRTCREILGMDEDSVSEEVKLEIETLFGRRSAI